MDSVNRLSNNVASSAKNVTSIAAEKAIKITDDITSSIPPPQKVYSLEASNTGYSTPFKVFVVVVILGFLGINILGYASVVMDMFMGIFGEPIKEIGKLFGFYTGETIKQTVEVSAEGTKFTADVAKDVVVDSVDAVAEQAKVVHDAVENTDAETIVKNEFDEVQEKIPYVDRDDLMKSFDNAKKNKPQRESTFLEDEANSNIQNGGGGTKGQQGWCYIGEDRGFRSCVEIGTAHECMSGNIFPTKEVCINPSLRH